MSTPGSSAHEDLETRQLDPSTTPSLDSRPTPDLGTRLGRYLLIEELGHGGMGRVLRAYDPKLQREVALKVLHPEAGDPQAHARLVREARAMAKLSHPNVVAVYDVDDDPVQGVVLAMELVEGPTLRQWLNERPRRWPEILAVFVEAGHGLAAAHAQGLLHRDFKPSNVLVTRDGSSGRERCKVTDFGLAKPEHDRAISANRSTAPHGVVSEAMSDDLTDPGAVVGTPRYMAPEQHRNDPLTSAADQYAFCVALWEALYGEPPFAGDTRQALLVNVLAGRLRTPTRAHAAPSWLRRACSRGLLVEPTQRWPAMAALLEALAKGRARATARAGATVIGMLALLAGGVELQRRWDESRRTAACEATGDEVETAWNDERSRALREALLATGASSASTTVDELGPRLEQQATAWRQARVEACLDADVHGRWDADTLDRSLWCLEERRVELESLVDELTVADADVLYQAVRAAADLASVAACRDEDVLAVLAPPPPEAREASRAVRADVVRAGNLQRAGRSDKGLELARDALERAEALAWPPLVATARLRVGWLLDHAGAYREAEAELERAYFDAARGTAPELAFEAAAALAHVVGVSAARYEEGLRWARFAELALEHVPDGEHLRQAGLFHNLANVHTYAGNFEEAKQLYERALAIQERALDPDHPDLIDTIHDLAGVHHRLGGYDEARRRYEQILAVQAQALGPEHPHVARTAHDLANVYVDTGRFDQAQSLYEQALAVRERAYGPEHPQVARSLVALAAVHAQTGRFDQAKPLLERALVIHEAVLGPRHPDVAINLANLANVLYMTEAYDEARALYERALAIQEQAFGPEHPDLVHGLVNLAYVHVHAGDHDQARALHERALAIQEQALGPDHPNLAVTLVGLAELALERHQPGEAVALARRATALREKRGVPPELVAVARFALARALWELPAEAGRDQARARALAEQARDAFRATGERYHHDLVEVEGWLAAHGSDEPASP